MREQSVDCVIVGGGIGGAVLALALGRAGRRVALLERARQPVLAARPEILARSTIETFQRLGVGSRIAQEAALPLQRMELWHQRRQLITFDAACFQRAGIQPYSTDPGKTREILWEAAASAGPVEAHRGVEVQELLRDGSRVIGVRALHDGTPCAWRAPLVVGDDGGHSRIRAALGIPISLRAFPLEFLAAAGPSLPGHAPGVGQAWIDPGRIRTGLFGGVFMPLPDGRTAMALLLSADALARFTEKPERFFDAAAQLSPRCEGLARQYRFPDGVARIQRPFGHAASYVAHGAALLGDAAHPVTPVGGQGANMSVADAEALSVVALAGLRDGECSRERLSAYEARRRAANARSLRFSERADRTLRLLRACPAAAPLLLRALAWVGRSPATQERFMRAASFAFVSPAEPK
jgi:2-polyprenyl-6-methoxyphenol hydroxylase-like FAD-dependent oxidoreductase